MRPDPTGRDVSPKDDTLSGLRVLFVLPECVAPPESGPAHLTTGLLRVAVRHLDCDVVGFARDEAERERWTAFEEAIPGVTLLRVFDRSRGARLLTGRVLSGIRGRPVSMPRFDSPALHGWLRTESLKGRWDLIHFDSFNVAQYRRDAWALPSVLIPYDAFSMGARQGLAAATRLPDRAGFRLKARMYRRFEEREYHRFAVVAPVADADARWLSHIDSRMNLARIQFPIGAEYVPLNSRTPVEPSRIVISGNFTQPEICASLCEFLREIYPRVRKQCPAALFTVWGRLPRRSSARTLLSGLPEVHHVEHVDDYLTFLRSFDLFLYPQRNGAGVQTKVQQAMAVGLSVVARPRILDGLRAQHGIHAFGHEDNRGFAQSVVALARDASLRHQVGGEASALIRHQSSPEKVWESLRGVYAAALAARQ